MDAGKPLPMALRENRVWGAKERLFERVLPRMPSALIAQLLQSAHLVDGITEGAPEKGATVPRKIGHAEIKLRKGFPATEAGSNTMPSSTAIWLISRNVATAVSTSSGP